MSDERSILSRWSARKRAVAAESPEPPVQDTPTDAEREAREAELEAELEANRLAAEAVDLETLDKDSDMSVFLREGVPDLLRKTALQKVWRSNPVFANLDELVDYGEDFGRKDLIMETFTSAWQAGRGYLKEVEDAVEDISSDAPDELAATDPQTSVPSDDDRLEDDAREDNDARQTAQAAPAAEERAETIAAEPDAAADTAPPERPADAAAPPTPAPPKTSPTGPVRSARGSLRARLARDTGET